MDALITAAGRALAAGDPLAALNLVALRSDPPALALRGIAMARLGDLDRAKDLLRRAVRAFGPREAGRGAAGPAPRSRSAPRLRGAGGRRLPPGRARRRHRGARHPPGAGVSGLESDGGELFYCGGGKSGKVRAVRRPR